MLRVAAVSLLSWPKATVVAPGARIEVAVRSSRRSAKLSLVSVDGNGTPTRAIARRTLRSGRFSAIVPAPGAYALRATIAGRRYWSWITADAPPPSCSLCVKVRKRPDCATAQGSSAAALQVASPALVRARPFSYAIANSGGRCLTAGAAYRFERQLPDGTWQNVPLPWPFPAYAVVIGPGDTFSKLAQLPSDAAAGTYRLVDVVTAAGGEQLVLTAGPFELAG